MTAHTWTICVDVILYVLWLVLIKITKKDISLMSKNQYGISCSWCCVQSNLSFE